MEAFPKKKNLFLALTLDSAREIIWDDLKDMCERMRMPVKFNEARSIARHANGSSIRLFGVNSSAKEMRKVLGQKYKKVFIDESGSMTIDMVKLCYQMIEPALIDFNGQLTLLGTCENIPQTFFEKVTMGRESGWSVHRWTSDQNPYVAENWIAKKNQIIKENPLVIHASWFRTHYLNEWCQDDDLLIIPYNRDRNEIDSLPSGFDWSYVLGVDLGFNDATSFSVLAFSPDHPICYRVLGFKQSGLILSKVGEQIKELQKRFEFFKIVVDGSNKQGVEDLKQRMGLPLVNAEKLGKAVYLKAMKDAIVSGVLKLVRGQNEDLVKEAVDGSDDVGEWWRLQWSDTTQQHEDPRCANHSSDGTLYAFRECKQYLYSPEIAKPKPGTDEFMKQYELDMARKIEQQLFEEQDQWMQNNLESY